MLCAERCPRARDLRVCHFWMGWQCASIISAPSARLLSTASSSSASTSMGWPAKLSLARNWEDAPHCRLLQWRGPTQAPGQAPGYPCQACRFTSVIPIATQ